MIKYLAEEGPAGQIVSSGEVDDIDIEEACDDREVLNEIECDSDDIQDECIDEDIISEDYDDDEYFDDEENAEYEYDTLEKILAGDISRLPGVSNVKTFAEAGVMSYDKGIVMKFNDRKYQLVIQRF